MMKLRDPEVCPHCGSRGTIIDSRKRVGYRRRVYTCRGCHVRWCAFLSVINPKLIERLA